MKWSDLIKVSVLLSLSGSLFAKNIPDYKDRNKPVEVRVHDLLRRMTLEEKIAEYQANGYSAEKAKTEAEKWVAIPGTSEHQLGLAVDINADGVNSAGYEVYDWLDKHAHEYGFIRRFPESKTDITGVANEPWHYRYVGKKVAAEIHDRGICLEEYLNQTEHE